MSDELAALRAERDRLREALEHILAHVQEYLDSVWNVDDCRYVHRIASSALAATREEPSFEWTCPVCGQRLPSTTLAERPKPIT